MVDPIKGGAEINMNDPSLLATLQCTLQCMRHAQKCITGTQSFLISKLGGWSTPLRSINPPRQRHQGLKHLTQYRCYGNRSVVGNRGGRWTLWNRGDKGPPLDRVACLQQAGKLPRRKRHRNTTVRRGARTSAVLLRKKETYPMGQSPHKGPSLTRDSQPHST